MCIVLYLRHDLGSLSENMNSYVMSMCTSSCSLHLTTLEHFILKFGYQCAPHRGVYLKPDLGTSSDNMTYLCTTSENDHIPLSVSNGQHKLAKTSSPVTGSFIMGGISEKLIWVCHMKIWVTRHSSVVITEICSYYIHKTNN